MPFASNCTVVLLPAGSVTVTPPLAFVVAIIRVEALPAAMLAGLAVTLTVGLLFGGGVAVTVTVALAVAGVVPLAPVAFAVYVVVAAGFTIWVPPVAAAML